MSKPSESQPNTRALREQIIGLGERSLRKSYFPQLQRQIEELRASEAKYRRLHESMMDAFVSVDMNGQLQEFNEVFQKMLGYTPEELRALSYPDFTPEKWHAFEADIVAKQVLARGYSDIYEKEYRRKDGTIFPVELRAILLRDEVGRHIGIWAIVRDITQRKQALENLRQHQEHLEELVESRTAELAAANKELQTFASAVSHDLRAPLRAIEGFSQILAATWRDRFDEQARTCLNKVGSEVQRMNRLIDALLQLSQATRAELRHEPVNLSQLALEIVETLRREQPNRRVDFNLASNLVTQGDPVLLRAALQNLLANAWKFTAKTPQARIQFGQDRQEGKTAYFVSDNGAGFDMGRADKLFAPFHRLHDAAEFPGTGVGLATVQQIIRRHGGKVWARSIPGEGATFCFTLQ